MKKKSHKDINMVDAWNEKYPSGTPVIVTRDNGDKLETVTRSVAWSMCGSAVVSVKGISGCYSLERVAPNTASTGQVTPVPSNQVIQADNLAPSK